MTAYEKLCTARKNGRPTAISYVNEIIEDSMELHGDRRFSDDAAIVAGIGRIGGRPVTYIAIEKGSADINDRMKRNFGCPKPEGYRKALRLMKQAEKFNRPVVCFVDTMGAFCGADAEERGQGEAIAENIVEMMGLSTPVITLVVGEGGSGGALALAAADRVYMMENAVYSVISPEGCASIVWKDSSKADKAAECLHITADDMIQYKVAERIIPEDFDHFKKMCADIKEYMASDLSDLAALPKARLLEKRYSRFRTIGIYEE